MTAASVTADLREARNLSAGKPSLWKRLSKAFVEARMRQAEREIAVYLELNGGRFTDQMERRILDRVIGIDQRGFGA